MQLVMAKAAGGRAQAGSASRQRRVRRLAPAGHLDRPQPHGSAARRVVQDGAAADVHVVLLGAGLWWPNSAGGG